MPEVYVVLSALYVLVPLLVYPVVRSRIERAKAARLSASAEPTTHFTVVTPAHNEAAAITGLVESVRRQHYPAHLIQHVVVADNCSDDTARLARAAGATVVERQAKERSDKTQALAFASEYLRTTEVSAGTCVVVDADSVLPPDFLREVSQYVVRGEHSCFQCYRSVLNASEAQLSTMDAAAEALRQDVILGTKDALGLEAHLHGNGTVFREDLFHACALGRQEPFADDKAWKVTLTRLGESVGWAPTARVFYSAVTESGAFQQQRKRWIVGQFEMIRTYALSLLSIAARRRDASALDFALSILQLPRSFVLVGALSLGLVGVLAPGLTWVPAWVYGALALAVFGYGYIGYWLIGRRPVFARVLGPGIEAIWGVAMATSRSLLGDRDVFWQSLRK